MNPVIEQLKHEIIGGDNAQQICNLMISWAVSIGSSDIHIEPFQNIVRLRYRVDGVLKEIIEYPQHLHQQIIARYKILSNLKIDESRMPQDGRISIDLDHKSFDLRVSTLPTVNGEKICMRIVDKSKKAPDFDKLGIEWRNRRVLEEAIAQPNGVILTSWPTGSGKSTTLYSCLIKMNSPEVNIMTLEDPVENTIDGINQSQMFPTIGYTFAHGLRTALRQDPDIIMVWEIRDKETIDIAIEASLTWHLVLSTIHTNSAAETITRILNMGVQSFLIPASVNAIIAQRLIRRVCENCRKAVPFNELDSATQAEVKASLAKTKKEELMERLTPEQIQNPTFFEPCGCEKCDGTGYKGRVGIYEIMVITPKIKEMIFKDASSMSINDTAVEEGMVSLEQDGVIKALKGHTTLAEVYTAVKDH